MLLTVTHGMVIYHQNIISNAVYQSVTAERHTVSHKSEYTPNISGKYFIIPFHGTTLKK